jgi:CBS domain containing-hemolysin-like protein
MEIEIISAIVILAGLVFMATVDMAFAHMSDVSLRRIAADAEADRKLSAAAFLREILENRPRFRFAMSSTIQVLLITFAVLLTLIVMRFVEGQTAILIYALTIGLIATVLFRQVLPRLFVRTNTEVKLLFLLPAVRPLYLVASAVVSPFTSKRLSKEDQRLEQSVTPDSSDDRSDDSDEDFQALMEVGEAEGIIEEREREMIETMVEFSDTRAGEIMTPRTEICALASTATIRDARELIIDEKYSRIPVYTDSIDNIVGMIYVRDLMQAWAEGKEDELVETVVRDPLFVPETITASELLKRMQSDRVQIAVVIDEYGGVAGLVTVEDILEEIVGEIEDEDTEQDEIVEIIEGDGEYWDVIGSTEIDKIERLFDLDLEDEDYNTIAGLVTSEAGYVPKVGEKLALKGLNVEILQADEKRLTLIRLTKTNEDEENEIRT